MSLQTVLWLIALVLFVLGSFVTSRVSLVAVGLAFLVAGLLAPALD